MSLKKIALTFLALITLYSVETNAASIQGNVCTLGVLPLGTTMALPEERDHIFAALEMKGFFPTELRSVNEVKNVEFIADGSVDCKRVYFGTLAQTTVRLIETNSNAIVSRVTTPEVMDMFSCKIELLKAISALPDCEIK